MILSDRNILEAVEKQEIVIDPFDRARLGTNSYDVTLAPTMMEVDDRYDSLDCRKESEAEEFSIQEGGVVLYPGHLYLGVTDEYTESHRDVPFLDGKSSIGRLGIAIHVTAGRGDVGFFGHWTMEIVVVRPVRVYAGMPIGQLIWFRTASPPLVPYDWKPGAKYSARGRRERPVPAPSQMWRNFGAKP